MSTLVNRPTGDAQTPHPVLFTPLRVGGGLSLSNRLAVAPMTRVSATAKATPRSRWSTTTKPSLRGASAW